MLDKLIRSHLDEVDTLKEKIDKEIDALIDDINIKELLKDPHGYMSEIASAVAEEIIGKHAKEFIKSAEKFAKKVSEDRVIKIQDSKDPNLNNDKSSS